MPTLTRRTAPILGVVWIALGLPASVPAQSVTPPAEAVASPIEPVIAAAAPAIAASDAPVVATPAIAAAGRVAAVPAIAAAVRVAVVPAIAAAMSVAPATSAVASTSPMPAQATAPPPPPAAPPEGATPGQDAPPPPPATPPPGAPRTPARTPPPPRAVIAAAPPGSADGPYVPKDVNIRVDATITESRGEQTLGRKVISVTLRDGDSGSVRSSALVPQPKFGGPPEEQGSLTRAPLNMDATVFLRDSGRVLARVTLEYNRGSVDIGESGTQRAAFDSGIRQSVAVILENSKPLVVAQSADPEGDRRVTLELKATVLK